jgi:hypothetical protein
MDSTSCLCASGLDEKRERAEIPGRYSLEDPIVWYEYIKPMNQIQNLASTIIMKMQSHPYLVLYVNPQE